MKITIKGTFPTLNEIINESKTHWTKYSKQKSLDTLIVKRQCKGLDPIKSPVYIHFDWFCKNRKTDPDNIAAGGRKVILDGMVESGFLSNDSWRWVLGFSDRFHVDRNPRVEIEIKEYVVKP